MISKQQFFYWLPVFYNAYIGKKGIYVIGYTKSGTNWLKNLIRHYYDIKLLPRYELGKEFRGERVYHMHRFLPSNYYRTSSVYMVRDGRDTIVSRYFTMVKQDSQALMKKDFIKFAGFIPTQENIKTSLSFYIKFLITYHKSTIDYSAHVRRALKEGYYMIKYEDLLDNTEFTFANVIKHLTPNEELDSSKLKDAIEFYSFEKSKKRQTNNTGFFRKGGGTSGDWKNHFNYESAVIYQDYAGDLLVKLGHEKDANWIDAYRN